MNRYELRRRLNTLIRILPQLGLIEDSRQLERNLTRDDLARWLTDPEALGCEIWRSIPSALVVAEHFGNDPDFGSPRIQHMVAQASAAYWGADQIVETMAQERVGVIRPPALASAPPALRVIEGGLAAPATLATSADGHVIAALPAPKKSSSGTIPAPPSSRKGGQAA